MLHLVWLLLFVSVLTHTQADEDALPQQRKIFQIMADMKSAFEVPEAIKPQFSPFDYYGKAQIHFVKNVKKIN